MVFSAVEEQFYLFWPLTLLLLVKKRPLVWIGIAIGAMIIAPFVFTSTGYFLTIHCSILWNKTSWLADRLHRRIFAYLHLASEFDNRSHSALSHIHAWGICG